MTKRITGDGPNPSGICLCGCGGKTAIAKQSYSRSGDVKGQPVRFIPGHGRRGRRGDRYNVRPDYALDPATGCWCWSKHLTRGGHGLTWDADRGGMAIAHRVFHERHNGPLPEGSVLHHLCRNRACVNPSHVTVMESQSEHSKLHWRERRAISLSDC